LFTPARRRALRAADLERNPRSYPERAGVFFKKQRFPARNPETGGAETSGFRRNAAKLASRPERTSLSYDGAPRFASNAPVLRARHSRTQSAGAELRPVNLRGPIP
jgi:hypothetical protein